MTESLRGRVESLTAHVAPDLAAEVRRLAEAGNRSVSREVSAALRAHVERVTSVERGGPTTRAVDPPAHTEES